MSRPYITRIQPNSGSTLEVPIILRGTDGEPIDLGDNPVLVSLIDVSAELGTPVVVVDLSVFGKITITIPWDDDRIDGQVYQFRVRYYFEGDDIVYTTPLFEVIYQ